MTTPPLDIDIEEGQTVYMVCPNCGSPKKSLGATRRDGVVLYNCFRASCGSRGAYREQPTAKTIKASRSTTAQEAWTIPKTWVRGAATPEAYNLLAKYDCMQAYRDGRFTCYYDRAEERLAVLIYHEGTPVGAVGRLVVPRKDTPKVLNYGDTSSPFVCHPEHKPTVAVLVEDVFSAIRATNYGVAGVALLGTNFKFNYLNSLTSYDKVHVALDRDARTKAVSIWRELCSYGVAAELMLLEADIKDRGLE